MKHALRKYWSNRGSALFMVVGTMSALIMLVTAMYLSVLSSREVQLTVFNQEQAYVSSTALSDMIQSYLNSGADLNNKQTPPLADKLLDNSFAVGSKMSTNGNGFAELTGNATDADETIFGAYDVTITRMEDEGTYRVFDIAVTVANNGIYETTHSLMAINTEDPELADMNETFAATGYVPNDVWVDSGVYNGLLYFDSEYTRIGDLVGSGGGLELNCEFRCAGSLVMDMATANPVELDDDDPGEWIVGNNMYINMQPRKFDLGGNSTKNGKMYIGGDLVMKERGSGIQFGGSDTSKTDVYVVGDCYITDMDKFYGDLYVGGDLYFVGRTSNGATAKIHLSPTSKVYLDDGNGKYLGKEDLYSAADTTKPLLYGGGVLCWAGTDYTTYNKYVIDGTAYNKYLGADEIDAFMATCDCTWNKQEAIDYLNNKLQQAQFYLWDVEDANAKANNIDISFKNDWTEGSNYVYLIDKDCTINDITATGNQVSNLTILIDTGKNPEDIRTIRLGKNNTDFDGDGVIDCFSWSPTVTSTWMEGTETKTSKSVLSYVNIITIGCGNLVIDVPAGVNYQAGNQEFFGHYSWFMKLGGTIATHGTTGLKWFKRADGFKLVEGADVVRPYVHKTCTSCVYSEKTKATDGSKYYVCNTHGGNFDNKPDAGKDCLCNNRLHNPPAYANTSGYGTAYTVSQNTANVNNFIVSSTESATINFCHKNVMNNVYFGFVYAPYMTYMDEGGGGGLKTVGGLIVSDYIMRGAYEYIQCYPDMNLSDVIGEAGVKVQTNKTWRVYGV